MTYKFRAWTAADLDSAFVMKVPKEYIYQNENGDDCIAQSVVDWLKDNLADEMCFSRNVNRREIETMTSVAAFTKRLIEAGAYDPGNIYPTLEDDPNASTE